MSKREPEKPHGLVFLSHAHCDADAAAELKKWLEDDVFKDCLEVFTSSDSRDIPIGSDWYEAVDGALRTCTMGIVLITKKSVSRPWISYELGALRAASKKTAPVCVWGMSKNELPSPFDRSQACDYDNEADRLKLLRSIASNISIPAHFITLDTAMKAPRLQQGYTEPGEILDIPKARTTYKSPLRGIFETSDRWTTVIYTCRATFTGENCPTQSPIKKALWAHVPVDEVQTVCLAVNQLMPSEARSNEDDILQTVMCSMQAEKEVLSGNHQDDSLGYLGAAPPLIERDWIVVGENNFSSLLLQMVRAYLPWQAGVSQTSKDTSWPNWPSRPPRPNVYIELVPRFNGLVPPIQTREVHRGGGMIALFPNPFNFRRRVLILFGCHRTGQFTLEHWLEGTEVVEAVEQLNKDLSQAKASGWGLQLVVNNARGPAGSLLDTRETAAIHNVADKRLYWLRPIGEPLTDDPFRINTTCLQPQDIYDLSLVARLEQDEQLRLKEVVWGRTGEFAAYWENLNSEIGFHITLYEFCTHYSPDKQMRLDLSSLASQLLGIMFGSSIEDRPQVIRGRLRGIELAPSALFSYVDFVDEKGHPTGWLESVRQWCEGHAEGLGIRSGLLNVMRVPFPAHVTLCRFDQEIPTGLQLEIRKVANATRQLELLKVPLLKLSLTVARRSPYKEVEEIGTIDLQGPPG
jgi:hypothetical protein